MVIDSDKRALTQIIINLVNNAIKFTDARLGQGDPQPASRRSAAGHRVCRHRHRLQHPGRGPVQAVPGLLAARFDLHPPRRGR
ncbi:hypothetical protein LP420_27590 [Massilia sp. B-10]|nr:hypothetical protein LP420_27590 [Massilia sp. B-10]